MIAELVNEIDEASCFWPYSPAADRRAWETVPKAYRRALIEAGEGYLGFAYPLLPAVKYMNFCRSGNQTEFDALYFSRRRALADLVMAECAEYEGRFLDDIINGIMAVCEESGWQVPAHNRKMGQAFECLPDPARPVMDLFACETGALLAMTSYLLEEELDAVSALIRRRIDMEIQRRITIPYLHDSFEWTGGNGLRVNNWTPWCTQNTLIAILAGTKSEAEVRTKAAVKAAMGLDCFLDGYGEDGGCDEGPAYYRTAGLCFFGAAEVLNQATNGYLESIYENSKIKNIAAFILDVHIADCYYANFADCAPRLNRSGVREYLFGKRTKNLDMMQYAAEDHRRDPDYLMKRETNLFYKLQAAFTEAEISAFESAGPVQTRDIYYESIGLFLARDEEYFLAVKAGGNDDSHNHNDTGSITVYRNGQPLLIDVGPAVYFGQTFSDRRYELWYLQSAYHNVMTFGEVMQMAGPEYAAKTERTEFTKERAVIEMELSGCYPRGSVGSYRRRVEFDKNRGITVTDTCKAVPRDAYFSFMTREKPVMKGHFIEIGGLGRLEMKELYKIETETIELKDPKLYTNWGPCIYRTKIFMPEDITCNEKIVQGSICCRIGEVL